MKEIPPLAVELVGWFRRVQKPLPWRARPTPYRTWIAEVMSQQTVISAVVPRFEAFVRELPDLRALASCPEPQLRALWAGLGYYARARNLKRGARFILDEQSGRFPKRSQEWLSVPGVGPYTASVIASICFGERVPAVDGNAIRVTSRLLALSDDVWSASGKSAIERYLLSQVRLAPDPGDFNQAVMELGQEVCRKRSPACPSCPVERFCLARAQNTVEACPPPRPTKEKKDVRLTVIVLRKDGKSLVAIGRRVAGFLKSTHGFPMVNSEMEEGRSILSLLRQWKGVSTHLASKRVRHAITHHRIVASVLVVDAASDAPKANHRFWRALNIGDPTWVDAFDVENSLSSSLDRKAWEIVKRESGSAVPRTTRSTR